jgi:hypothetical protein
VTSTLDAEPSSRSPTASRPARLSQASADGSERELVVARRAEVRGNRVTLGAAGNVRELRCDEQDEPRDEPGADCEEERRQPHEHEPEVSASPVAESARYSHAAWTSTWTHPGANHGSAAASATRTAREVCSPCQAALASRAAPAKASATTLNRPVAEDLAARDPGLEQAEHEAGDVRP